MIVTDKMVEAAVEACNMHSIWQKTEYDFMRIAIQAALSVSENEAEMAADKLEISMLYEMVYEKDGEIAEKDAEIVRLRKALAALAHKPE